MRKFVILLCCVSALMGVGSAQKKMKPWTEWSEKDCKKILEDSPWSQTQTETDTSEMFYSPTTQTGAGSSTARNERGALNQSTNVNFRIRFLSAKPVRQALARLVGAKQPELADSMKTFIERDFSEFIVVAVTFDSTDQRFSGPAMQTFNSANTGLIKNNTYLEVKGGRRLFLQQYQPPSRDGLGAKFIFPRVFEEKAFITPESGDVRFYAELGNNMKLNMRFKVADMMYEGKLEY